MSAVANIRTDYARPVAGFQRCGHATPSCPLGYIRFDYKVGGVDLACDMEYEAAESGSRYCGIQMEPDYPEHCEIAAVWCRDQDISSLLSEDITGEITKAFLAQRGEE